MPSEMPRTSRVRKVSQAWGMKLAVVRLAAAKPIHSVRGMVCLVSGWEFWV